MEARSTEVVYSGSDEDDDIMGDGRREAKRQNSSAAHRCLLIRHTLHTFLIIFQNKLKFFSIFNTINNT